MPGTDRQILLRDGRRLGYAEFGDPRGRPWLHHHGFPGSRVEAALAHGAACRAGARLIAVDRPGFGLSDHHPSLTLAAWPGDVIQLAEALGLERFSVVGVSGGAPFALACAWRLRERLDAVDLVCGLGPMDRRGAGAGMSRLGRLAVFLSRRAPWCLKLSYPPLASRVARHPERLFERVTCLGPPADRAVLGREDVRQVLERSVREAFRRGADGALRDLLLYGRRWDVPLEQISVEVHLWHGEADTIVPSAAARLLARRLPRARVHLFPEEGHFSLAVNHAEEMFRRKGAA